MSHNIKSDDFTVTARSVRLSRLMLVIGLLAGLVIGLAIMWLAQPKTTLSGKIANTQPAYTGKSVRTTIKTRTSSNNGCQPGEYSMASGVIIGGDYQMIGASKDIAYPPSLEGTVSATDSGFSITVPDNDYQITKLVVLSPAIPNPSTAWDFDYFEYPDLKPSSRVYGHSKYRFDTQLIVCVEKLT